MLLTKEKLQHINTIAHEGKVVVFATDGSGKIHYTIKQDGFEDSYLNTPADQRTGWEDWQELEFPNEPSPDQSVIDKETEELTHQDDTSNFILCSRYRTQDQSAVAPVQVVSGVGHIYVFRQSKADTTEVSPNTLMVDRFVLDGMTNKLVRKLEVRFKRSRQKYKPIESMKKKANGGGLANIDSLDFRDADNQQFYEPTIELSLINNLHNGWFSVVQVPTSEHDIYRWHIFAYNSVTEKVELTTIRASEEGLFDVQDYTIMEAKPEAKSGLVPRSIPGIIQRSLDLNGVEVGNGFSATKYNIQKEQQTKDGMQLLKDATKVMLAIPTTADNVAAISFSVAADGTLSQIDETPDQTDILRSNSRDLLLPLNTLDEIKGIGDSTPPPQGTITGVERGEEDRIEIMSPEAADLTTGDVVKISDTQSYNGHYVATKLDADTFEIDASYVNGDIGSWEVIPPEETGLIFDGAITCFEKVTDNKLKVTAFNHGLESGDEVQIVDTTDYNRTCGIEKIDESNFAIEGLRWKSGEAVNLKLESRKRRGVMFNGSDEYIDIPKLALTPPSTEFAFGYSLSAWVYVSANGTGEQIIVGEKEHCLQLVVNNNTVSFNVKFANGNQQVTDTEVITPGQWMHYAGVIASDGTSEQTRLTLCKNGQQVGTKDVAELPNTPENWQPEFEIGKSFAGKVADVQIWDKVRTVKDIKDSMYLQLTGREVDLVGYWRLGAITEGKERNVVDFSINGNDGIVHGDAFVSAITLNRTLGDNTTQIVKYSNDDLVAVTARATYVETFEFKTDANLDPNNVDGDGNNNKLFSFSYWGKKNRSSEDQIAFDGTDNDFESLDGNWYKATCSFTVPDGVAIMRTFELGEIKGTWSTLEIRKHRVQLISDSISQVKYTDSVSLSTLADQYAQLPEKLTTLEQKEKEEAELLKEKRDLEYNLHQLDHLPELRIQVQALQNQVNSLQPTERTQRNWYQQQLVNPFNYYCYVLLQSYPGRPFRPLRNELSLPLTGGGTFIAWEINGTKIVLVHDPTIYGNLFKFSYIGGGNQYRVSIKSNNNILRPVCASNFQDTNRNDIVFSTRPESDGSIFKFDDMGNHQYHLNIRPNARSPFRPVYAHGLSDTNGNRIVSYHTIFSNVGNGNLIKLVKTNDRSNTVIERAKEAWDNTLNVLQPKQIELARLQQILNEGDAQKTQWEERLEEITTQLLPALQTALAQLNTSLINISKDIQLTAQEMPVVHTVNQGSQKGLVTKGGVLGFAAPATRITAIETCEGNVQLSYFDHQGRMRLTNYDATSDSSNTAFEQWLPDDLPVALNFADGGDKIQLSHPVYLGESWTMETWFSYPLPKNSESQIVPLGKIQAEDKQTNDWFGYSVAISGDTAIVGASREDTGGTDAGSAYIFQRQNGSWSQVQKLQAQDKQTGDWFGYSVAISGDTAIVGASKEDTGGTYAGSAYIFQRQSNGSWSQVQKIQAQDKEANDYFSGSIAISGDTAIVSASGEDTGGTNAGSAYIFQRQSNGSWSQVQKIQAQDKEANDYFSGSVAISGDTAIVSASSEDTGGGGAGSAYIFQRQNGSWSQVQKLQAQDKQVDDHFGSSVAISGDTAIVGAFSEDTGGKNAGSAYIFQRQNGSWSQVQKIQAQDKQVEDQFGRSVAISGDTAIVGAQCEDTGGDSAGSAYIFQRQSNGSWSQVQKIQAQDKQVHDYFGSSVAISGNTVIVGAFLEDTGGNNAGSAYLYQLLPTTSINMINVLLAGDEGNHPVVVTAEDQHLGTTIEGEFYDSGYDLKRLASGWHHLTAVGKESTIIFYIDGKQIANVKQAVIDAEPDADKKQQLTAKDFSTIGNISTIGNSQDGSQQFGKLSELRLWNLALTAEEIAVNSTTRLSGNEPGLVAYYPLNEATGTEIRDKTGSGNNGTVAGATWWGCNAPIGNVGQKVKEFDGTDDYVEVEDFPYVALGTGHNATIEVWIKTHSTAFIFSKNTDSASANSYEFSLNIKSDGGGLRLLGGGTSYFDTSVPVNDGVWHHIALVAEGNSGKLYIDGHPQGTSSIASNSEKQISLLIGAKRENTSSTPIGNFFKGQMAEFRIWNKARTVLEIKADMRQRLTGKESGLVGYFPLNTIQPEGDTQKVLDLTGNNHHGTVNGAITKDSNTLPIGGSALVSAEYSTIVIDPISNKKSAIMRRFFGSPALDGVELLPEKRIEQLELKWIGNAQFAPTLLGYIEGAPPIPTENLTVQEDYNSATSVELNTSEDVEFSWYRSQDAGLGASLDAFLGSAGEVSGGVGIQSQIGEWKAGFKGNLDLSYQWQNESNIASSSSLSMSDRLELRGTQESGVKFSHLGKRFIPKNIGYALVVSSLADVFITRLKRSKKMIGYQVQPVDGVPPDVNTITFLINPAYTMSGSLDGMTGSSATSDRFFRHVPEMRAQYGSLYPASYYRLQEAYDLKQQIEKDDKRRESYFEQFNAGLVDEGSLNREIDSGEAPTEIGVTRETDKPDEELSEEEKQAAQERKQQQIEQEAGAAADKQSKAAKQKQKEIKSKINDQEKRAHATDSFASWQKRMENIQVKSGKRNIVNTYVWDADGGLRTEAQSFANTIEHTVGGSFSLGAGLGFQGDFTAGAAGELTALVTINLTQTMNKTESRSKGLELNVDLSGVESTGITDYNDYPIQPGEKVDRYRFMSFYLEGTTKNFNDFFTYVVDPEWLASNDEEARALRQAKGKANKTWRVLHRVTYVERPALMGFGRDIRQVDDENLATQEILDYFNELDLKNQELKAEIEEIKNSNQELSTKLDQVLNAITAQQTPSSSNDVTG